MEILESLNIAYDDFTQILDLNKISSNELLMYYIIKYNIAARLTTDNEFVGKSFDNLDSIEKHLKKTYRIKTPLIH